MTDQSETDASGGSRWSQEMVVSWSRGGSGGSRSGAADSGRSAYRWIAPGVAKEE
jgi:hypothetical protein